MSVIVDRNTLDDERDLSQHVAISFLSHLLTLCCLLTHFLDIFLPGVLAKRERERELKGRGGGDDDELIAERI